MVDHSHRWRTTVVHGPDGLVVINSVCRDCWVSERFTRRSTWLDVPFGTLPRNASKEPFTDVGLETWQTPRSFS